MKTVRLLYPDHAGGGLDTYYFGAKLLQHILPPNSRQPLIEAAVSPPDSSERPVTDGIFALDEVLTGIKAAQAQLKAARPDKIITIGGNCLASLAPFDYLHGLYPKAGIVWIDAHPDVSAPEDGYPNAHAMVLSSLLGKGAPQLAAQLQNPKFEPDEILYIGLQPLHGYQERFLKETGIAYKIQDKELVSESEIKCFMSRFERLLIHFDIDALDERLFHSTYFANPELVGDGSGGGRMTIEKLTDILKLISDGSDIAGFTIAEYLPFDEHKLHKMLSRIKLFTE